MADEHPEPCCTPSTRSHPVPAGPPVRRSPRAQPRRGQVLVPGGTFAMGDHHDEGYPADGETPVHTVEVPAFWVDATAVTNAAFATFVKDTGHRTVAEQAGTSAVFQLAGPDPAHVVGQAAGASWWLVVRDACWRRPEGPGSDVARRSNHPVVHIAYDDALAYAAWSGRRLPTEAEWEYAARGGLAGARFAWGDELTPRGRHQANIWQGEFPHTNTADDGWVTTAPVTTYRANGYGLHQVAGNVWEWCADWFDARFYAASPATDPQGPASGTDRVLRGGSYLCHDSYCHRYRVAARSHAPGDAGAANVGFRCASDA